MLLLLPLVQANCLPVCISLFVWLCVCSPPHLITSRSTFNCRYSLICYREAAAALSDCDDLSFSYVQIDTTCNSSSTIIIVFINSSGQYGSAGQSSASPLHCPLISQCLVSLSLSLFTDTNTPFVLVHFQHGFPFSLLGSDIGLLLQTTTTTTYYHTATTTVCNGCQCCFNLPTTTLKHICQLPLMCCSVCWILTVNTR